MPILTTIFIFIIVLTYFLKRSDKIQEERENEFWRRERESKLVPPVDLNTIAYLNIPIEKFYFGSINTPEVKSIEKEITALSKKPLLNLTGKTNTELRETYGSPNLEAMKKIGDDFDRLTIILVSYAEALINNTCITQAITVLEYGVYIKSDVSKTYTLLGDCFAKLGQPRRIETLKEQVYPLHLIMEPSIIAHLDKLLEEQCSKSEDFNLD